MYFPVLYHTGYWNGQGGNTPTGLPCQIHGVVRDTRCTLRASTKLIQPHSSPWAVAPYITRSLYAAQHLLEMSDQGVWLCLGVVQVHRHGLFLRVKHRGGKRGVLIWRQTWRVQPHTYVYKH